MLMLSGLCLFQVFSPSELLVLTPALGQYSCHPSTGTEHAVVEQGLEARLPNMKSLIPFPSVLLPLPLVLCNNELLLLLSDLPGCFPLLLLCLKVPPFGSLIWLRHQRRGTISRDDLEFPRRGGKSMGRPNVGGWGSPFLSRVTRIWGVASLSTSHGPVKSAAPFVPGVFGCSSQDHGSCGSLLLPPWASPSTILRGLSGALHGSGLWSPQPQVSQASFSSQPRGL